MVDISFLGDTPFERLKALMKTLRDPKNGCEWDRAQTYDTIAPYTIEEAYEVDDAIRQKDMQSLKSELGDLLFQVIFYARMAEEDSLFDLEDICDTLCKKMVRRHPHIFETGEKRTADAQKLAWEDMKAEERKTASGGNASVLSDVPLALPALTRAEKLQKRAARVGFDWPDINGVIDKIHEELAEVATARQTRDADALEDEIGDVLFAIVNLARWDKVDPEAALRRTNAKFSNRFQFIEDTARENDQLLTSLSLDELESLWRQAKTSE